MAWYAKFDGVDGSAQAFNFMPEKEDADPVAPASGDIIILDVPTSAGPNAGAYGYFLTKQPTPIDYNADWDAPRDLIAVVDDDAKPSLVVKFDIGGPLLDV